MRSSVFFRSGALLIALGLTMAGTYLFARFSAEDGITGIDILRCLLVAISGFWLVWGSAAAVFGVFTPSSPRIPSGEPAAGRTAILVPIYNEDAMVTFARIAAMNRSIIAQGLADRFHFVVLSDSQSMECAALEAVWFERLLQEPQTAGRVFYRRRERNIGRKAGNVEDFIAHSGAAYDYAVILDADSLMEGATMAHMARRMEQDPALGLLQTVPHIINARTLFGRSIQFAASYLSPTFARGAALMQGNEGPYWGHNAIVRIAAFAASCGLPELSGKPPFGGHILSHDYVEAALLSRAGWKVQVDALLPGSYEEGPENLLEYAKRDRRWCQGNLQHGRLVSAPGLKWWSRFTFVRGIMAYVASPLWLLLLATTLLAAIFPGSPTVFAWAGAPQVDVWMLGVAVAVTLVLPKMLILFRGVFDGHNRRFGGTAVALLSVVGEIVLSTVLAPTMLLLQSRAVAQVLLGLDGGWPSTRRGQNCVGFVDALRASWWIVALAAMALGSTLIFAPAAAAWLTPAMLPALLAPLLISATSHPARRAKPLLFRTELEIAPTSVLIAHQTILTAWASGAVALESYGDTITARAPGHVAA
ncbi:MAG: glucans biosynthesis glucosyltransferase MdoH [Devosia sp.]